MMPSPPTKRKSTAAYGRENRRVDDDGFVHYSTGAGGAGDSTSHESDGEPDTYSPARKKSKKRQSSSDDDEEDDTDDDKNTITFHINFVSPAKRPGGRFTTVPKDPIFLDPETIMLGSLLVALSRAVRCSVTNIDAKKLKWRFESGKTGSEKLLGSEPAVKAMRQSIAAKRRNANRAVIISMAPVIQAVTRDANEEDEEETEVGAIGASIRAQKESLAKSTSVYLEMLKEHYPIGNDPCFPDQRIFKNDVGHIWGLNDVRMQLWGKSMKDSAEQGLELATLDKPPTSIYFSESHRIKTIPAAPQDPAVPPPPMPFAPPMYPPYYGHYPMYPPHQVHLPPNHYLAYPQAPPATSPAKPQDANIPLSPQKLNISRRCSIEEFCFQYGLPERDEDRLADLEFVPGNRYLLKLEPEEWKAVGFTRLSWEAVLAAHARFVDDVRAGRWPAPLSPG
ncbi:hypothetical protein C8J56DRAFT_1063221 [Mycena floridula]|nr:hypothetical protein C8J56DRAFT_1063221 [Mycena floridula]